MSRKYRQFLILEDRRHHHKNMQRSRSRFRTEWHPFVSYRVYVGMTSRQTVYASTAPPIEKGCPFSGSKEEEGRSCLLLLAGGAAESVRDCLASVAETLLGALEDAATLVLGLVAA
jgi:hypothetical protein